MAELRKEHRRNRRLRLESPLRLVMGSIGAEVHYELSTHNISQTGLFLDFAKPGRFPFTPASILEIWLEIGQDQVVFFNGKMARVVYPSDERAVDTGPGIAVRIVQIDAKNEDMLNGYLDANVRKYGQKEGVVA